MMRVLAVYVGNAEEAYIEESLSPGMNIVYSDDNHVGKSIVMQSLMFTLGSDPIFPGSFQFRNYYYVVDLDVDGEPVSVLRKKDAFVVIRDGNIIPFASASEFRRYWHLSINTLPFIVKNGEEHLVFLSLYNQMYFVPQSERSSAQITNPGMYNKKDFVEMVYASMGLSGRVIDEEEESRLKLEREELRGIKKRLLKQAKSLNIGDPALSMISVAADSVEQEVFVKELDRLTKQLQEFRKKRNRLRLRIKKSETVLGELRSLNMELSDSKLVCFDCGSERIGFEIPDSNVAFDITTSQMRSQILASLKEKINDLNDDLARVESDLKAKQVRLNTLLDERDVSLEDVIVYQEDSKTIEAIDTELAKTDERISEISDILKASRGQDKDLREKRKDFKRLILDQMNYARDRLCLGEEHASYEDMFTTQAEALTGSELTEYCLARSYALAITLNHEMPIVIDSFRAEDLSTERESKALELFSSLERQIIFSTTIKDEEHDKYESYGYINAIDYSDHLPNKLLSEKYLDAFLKKLDTFGIIPR